MSSRRSPTTSSPSKSTTSNDEVTPSKNKVEDLEGFDSDFVKRAIVGLTKYLSDKKDGGGDLLETNGEAISLTFELAKIPPGVDPKVFAIDLQYPLYQSADVNVCIIASDPQKKWKELLKSQWNREEHNGMDMPKIIGLSKLKSNYSTPTLKRQLLRTYDVFFCDTRIIDQMPRILGRPFIDANKMPIDLKVRESSLLSNLNIRLNQTFMRMRTGPTISVRIGRAQDSPKHLYQNAIKVLSAVSRYFNPSDDEITASTRSLFRDNEIRAIHLTATNSPSLPVYLRASVSEAVEMVLKMKKRMENSESEMESAIDSEAEQKKALSSSSKSGKKKSKKETTIPAAESDLKKKKRSSAAMESSSITKASPAAQKNKRIKISS